MEFDINKNAFCITINDDKYNFMCERFRKVGIEPPKRFNGFVAKGVMHYVKANIYGQISIIERARQENLPYVIIYEDDAFPCSDINERLKKVYASITNVKCHVMYLGRNGDASRWNEKIESLHGLDISIKHTYSSHTDIDDTLCTISKNVFGNHAYVVFREGYDRAIYAMLESLITQQMSYADIALTSGKYTGNVYVTSPLFIQYNINNGEVIHMNDVDNGTGYMVVEDIHKFNNRRFSNE